MKITMIITTILVSFIAIFIQFPIYPAVSIIMLNYFPFYKSLKHKIGYILLVSVLFTAFDWFTVWIGFLYYTIWKLWYSALCYPVLIIILALNLWGIRKIKKSECN